MAISNKLIIVFTFFYLGVIIYLFVFLTNIDFQNAILQSREDLTAITEGSNYYLILLFSFLICLLGNASVGFPVPYPFILFSFSNSIYLRFATQGLLFGDIIINGQFWLEIIMIAILGGLGSAIGEFVSFYIGKGISTAAKKIGETTHSTSLENVKGFGKIILEHPKTMYFYIFLAAALPIPDDPLWIALGMSERKVKISSCLLWGWLGKNLTTIFYVILPILLFIGLNFTGIEFNDISSVITEAIMLLATLSMMLFILSFNWDKYFENRNKSKNSTK
jgi:hypothetical protein